MNHVKKLNQYFNELARTYHLFFKSAPLIATCVLLLAPLQAVVPLIAVAAGQKVIDQVTNHSPLYGNDHCLDCSDCVSTVFTIFINNGAGNFNW